MAKKQFITKKEPMNINTLVDKAKYIIMFVVGAGICIGSWFYFKDYVDEPFPSTIDISDLSDLSSFSGKYVELDMIMCFGETVVWEEEKSDEAEYLVATDCDHENGDEINLVIALHDSYTKLTHETVETEDMKGRLVQGMGGSRASGLLKKMVTILIGQKFMYLRLVTPPNELPETGICL